MNRKEAIKNIGEPVFFWTGLHGTYNGILISIDTPEKMPWRGNIEVLEVIDYPTIGLFTRRSGILERKPFDKHFIANVGGINIMFLSSEESINDYNKSVAIALERTIKKHEKNLSEPYNTQSRGIMQKALDILKERRNDLI